MERKKQAAISCFQNGFNCSQAVLSTFSEELGLTTETALKISTCFGGGMRNGEVCGAITGGLMVIGLKYGHSKQGDDTTKTRAYQLTREFTQQFKEKHGTLLCRQLLGYDLSDPEQLAIIKEKQLFDTICPRIIEDVVEMVEKVGRE
ncbi:C-GCAxxG-C-C family protein [Parabacteroides sp. FAFU027]|uniref:C-GCAxxG-C-C family protein n=1 Tax=Parabacteroides sp. FAFU027 TaxID=2922715 RepID=UPI001FAFB2BB|nr:C-GCAxxG-C-C family protein [Parabacteroides sp. FAFU027]